MLRICNISPVAAASLWQSKYQSTYQDAIPWLLCVAGAVVDVESKGHTKGLLVPLPCHKASGTATALPWQADNVLHECAVDLASPIAYRNAFVED
jgi:hypothetical protein